LSRRGAVSGDPSPRVRIKALIFLDDALEARRCRAVVEELLKDEREHGVRKAAAATL
jgi:hypothetical protein